MRTVRLGVIALALVAGYAASESLTTLASEGPRGRKTIEVLDNCLPGDPAWNPTGGCTLSPKDGDVSNAEFGMLLRAPTVPTNTSPSGGFALVGHPSWRNEPSHLVIKEGQSLSIVNNGGRGHTFTEVPSFGGGQVPPLNVGLVPLNQCAQGVAVPLPPGGREKIDDLAPGLHRFQCCIHPWMRATVRVE